MAEGATSANTGKLGLEGFDNVAELGRQGLRGASTGKRG